MIIRIVVMLIVLAGTAAHADVAILPYRVKNPSDSFEMHTGVEYAKLLTVAVSLKSTLPVFPQRDVSTALKTFKIDTQKLITAEDLVLLGEGKFIDYILAGTIAKLDRGYVSESVLFSVREKRVLAKTKINADTLFELAEREVRESFPQFAKKQRDTVKKNLDIAFMIDMSYSIDNEWGAIQEGITDISRNYMGTEGIDSRVYIVPYSDRYTFDKSFVAVNSMKTLTEGLGKLKPVGAFKKDSFEKALRYAVQSIIWRNDAGHILVIINNSPIPLTGFPERYALVARKKKILINSLSLGKLKYDTSELQDQLAHISGGRHEFAAYHQRLFDKDGKSIDVYFEAGRLFYSLYGAANWHDGILTVNPYQPGMARVRGGLDEIHDNGSGKLKNPYTIPEIYPLLADGHIVSHQKLETNIPRLLRKMITITAGEDMKTAGRVLLSDGTISMWADIPDAAFLEFYRQRMQSGLYSTLGVSMRNDSASPYGISVVTVENRLNSDDVPKILKTGFSEMMKDREYHMYKGLLSPSVWFVTVKVLQIKAYRQRRDIRDE